MRKVVYYHVLRITLYVLLPVPHVAEQSVKVGCAAAGTAIGQIEVRRQLRALRTLRTSIFLLFTLLAAAALVVGAGV